MHRYSAGFAGLFLAYLTYAVVRYNVFKGVPWAHLPVYVVNKAVSLLAITLLAVAAADRGLVPGPNAKTSELRRWFGLAGVALAGLHVLMSQAILAPEYYGKLFGGDRSLTLSAELALLFGAVAFVVLLSQAWKSLASSGASPPADHAANNRRLAWTVVTLSALHCAALGWGGWWPPSSWPGTLPPITLIAVLIAVVAAAFRLVRR